MPAPGHTHKSLSQNLERSSLQWTVGLLALIPIGTGLAGAMFGVRAIEPYASVGVDAESLSRYFSGLLLAIGLAFLTTLPRIEAEGERFRLLTMIVFVGGVARLFGVIAAGLPTKAITIGLAMELVVTPALALWRERIESMTRSRVRPRSV